MTLRQRGDKPRLVELALLACASPMIAELLSSSAPPLQFFIPWVFTLFATFYGCAAILAREITLRRGGGWPQILCFGAAFAVLEEGLSAKVFFDPDSPSLGALAGHGRWLGVNVTWTLDGIAYHAVFSIALPILLVYQIRPESANVRWVGRFGLTVTAILFCLSSWVFLANAKPYQVPAAYEAACWVAIAALTMAGLRRHKAGFSTSGRTPVSPRRYAALGFFSTLALLLHIFVIPGLVPFPAITLVMAVVAIACLAWLMNAWTSGGSKWGLPHQSALLAGALGCLSVIAMFHEINPTRTYDATGMSLVGVASLVGLRKLWRKNSQKSCVRQVQQFGDGPADRECSRRSRPSRP